MKKVIFIILIGILLNSCTWWRERKAEHHQPFKNHKEKSGHKYHQEHHK
jgi:hypothetical protein